MTGEFIVPDSGSQHRVIFDNAYKRNEWSLMSLASASAQLEKVRDELHTRQISSTGSVDAKDISSDYADNYRDGLIGYLRSQSDYLRSRRFGPTARWRRLEVFSELCDQIVLLPELFRLSGRRAKQERSRLIKEHGIYGLIGKVLAGTLEDFNDQKATVDTYQYRYTKGLVTELTGLALYNRPQLSNQVMLPASLSQDHFHQTDMVSYSLTRNSSFGKSALTTQRCQVKTNEQQHQSSKEELANQILLIGGLALGNGRCAPQWADHNLHVPWQTSYAIVHELKGDDTQSKADSPVLDVISRQLINAIHNGRHFILPKASVAN